MLVDGPHFQATNGGELVFLHSDGDSSRRPSEHDILELEEESGTALRNYYLHLPLEHPDSDRWRAEIAKYLAPLVLGSKYNLLTHSLPQCTYFPSSVAHGPFPGTPPTFSTTATTSCNAVNAILHNTHDHVPQHL